MWTLLWHILSKKIFSILWLWPEKKEKRKSYWFYLVSWSGVCTPFFLSQTFKHHNDSVSEHCEDTKPVSVPIFSPSNILRSSSEFLFIILYHTQFYDIFMGFLAVVRHGMVHWYNMIHLTERFFSDAHFDTLFHFSCLCQVFFFFFHSVLNAQAHTSSFNGIDLFLFPLLLAIVMLYWRSFFPFDI